MNSSSQSWHTNPQQAKILLDDLYRAIEDCCVQAWDAPLGQPEGPVVSQLWFRRHLSGCGAKYI